MVKKGLEILTIVQEVWQNITFKRMKSGKS